MLKPNHKKKLFGPASLKNDGRLLWPVQSRDVPSTDEENRKIEELILLFATHATSVLRKDPTLTADGKWLNNHIVQFAKLLRESLRNISHVSPELTAHLDVYAAKLAPSSQTHHVDSGYDSSSTSQRDSVSSPGATASVADMPLVNIVANLFQIRSDLLQPEVDKLRSVCTERVRLFARPLP